jgi:PKD domain
VGAPVISMRPGPFRGRPRRALARRALYATLIALLIFGGSPIPSGAHVTRSGWGSSPLATLAHLSPVGGRPLTGLPSVGSAAALSVVVNVSAPTPATREKVNLTAVPSGGSGSYTCKWTFGDSSIGAGCATAHAWSRAGSYHITVTVTDSLGDVAARSLAVTAVAPPGAGGASSSGPGPSEVWESLLAVLALGAAVLVAILIYQRRARSRSR